MAKGDREVDGRSILDLMMLGAARGDEIMLIVDGEDAPAALASPIAAAPSGPSVLW